MGLLLSSAVPEPALRLQHARRHRFLAGLQEMTLHGNFPTLAERWHQLDEVMVLTRNAEAILAEFRPYPEMTLAADRRWVVADGQTLSLDFSRWAEVGVRRETTPLGEAFTFEVHHADGLVLHKVCLTPASDHAAFADLLEHRQLGLGRPPEITDDDEVPAPWRRPLAGRLDWIERLPKQAAVPALAEMLGTVLCAAAQERLPLRTQLFSDVALQTHEGILQRLEKQGERLVGGTGRGRFQVDLPELGSVWLVSFACPCCRQHKWTLEAYNHRREPVLTWSAAGPEQEEAWRRLLRRRVKNRV